VPRLGTGQPRELSQFLLLQSRGTSTALKHAGGSSMLLWTQWREGQQEEDAAGGVHGGHQGGEEEERNKVTE
jgi:hypothetical protein